MSPTSAEASPNSFRPFAGCDGSCSDQMKPSLNITVRRLWLVVSVLFAPATWAEPTPIDQLVQRALARNPSIQAAKAKWEAALRRITEQGAWEDPKVSFNTLLGRFVAISPNGFTDQSLTLEQAIPLSGKNRTRARIAMTEAVTAYEDFRRQQLDVAAKVKQGIYRISNLLELLNLNRQDEATLVDITAATKSKFEVGTQSAVDYLTVDLERQKIAETRRDLEEKLGNERTALQVLLSDESFSGASLPPNIDRSTIDLSYSRLRQLTIAQRPEIRQAEAAVQGMSAKVELAKRDWIPDPEITVQAERYNSGSQLVSELNAGVSISLPWVNRSKYRAAEDAARSDLAAAQNTLEAAQTEAFGKLRDQLIRIETIHHHIELYRDQLIPSARQTVESGESDYAAGKANLTQALTAENNLRQLEVMYQQDLTDYQIALTDLAAIVGADLPVGSGKNQKRGMK